MAKSGLTERARRLRRESTDAERALWASLRDRRLLGFKFARQVPIGPYVVDFACRERKLVVELDGGQHLDSAARDETRTQHLRSRGYEVLRFWNHDVLSHPDSVLEAIRLHLDAAD